MLPRVNLLHFNRNYIFRHIFYREKHSQLKAEIPPWTVLFFSSVVKTFRHVLSISIEMRVGKNHFLIKMIKKRNRERIVVKIQDLISKSFKNWYLKIEIKKKQTIHNHFVSLVHHILQSLRRSECMQGKISWRSLSIFSLDFN